MWMPLLLHGSAALACPSLPHADVVALRLDTALARVSDCHPDVRAARSSLAAATADVRTAAQRPNPQLTLGAGAVGHDLGGGSFWNKTFDHQLRVDQLLERGDKPALRQAVAQWLQRASRADSADAMRQAKVGVAAAYFDLAAALNKQRALTVAVALNEESQRALERRAQAGDAAPLDATRFSLDATRAQADLSQASADVRAMRVQLARLLGVDDQVDALTPVPDDTDPAMPAEDLTNAIDRRPDVVAAQARVSAAEQALALASAQRKRDVGMGVELSHYPVSSTNTAGTGNTVSLSVSVPLFVQHAYEGEISRAQADLNTAQELLRRVRLTAQADVARIRIEWQAAATRYRIVTEQLVPSAERVAAGAELAYRRGATGVLDVLDARRSLRAALIERITAQADRSRSAAQLQLTLESLESPIAP
ncbi:MAG TPA: TolC family protein [Burkholderiaceae bacterium]